MKQFSLYGLLLVAIAIAMPLHAAERVAYGRFGSVIVYRPQEIKHAAIIFSDRHGWDKNAEKVALTLMNAGVLAIGVDLQHYANELAKPKDKCSYLAGEFENLSHEMQKRFSPQRYHLPVLVGMGEGASLVYAIAAQGTPGTFAGTLTLGFCPTLPIKINLCRNFELKYEGHPPLEAMRLQPNDKLSTAWTALQGREDKVCPAASVQQFAAKTGLASSVIVPGVGHVFNEQESWQPQLLAAFDRVATIDSKPKVVAGEMSDLPLEEVPAVGKPSRHMALFLTGDGGWADLDKQVSGILAQHGVFVVALNSLQFYWQARTPEQASQAVARILRHYLTALDKEDAIVIGYSFGADTASFIVNRLPADLRSRIRTVNLLGLASSADFEVHVTNWIGVNHHGPMTRPEVDKLPMPVLCVYGEGEKDTLCPQLTRANTRILKIGDGHHFGGEYKNLAEQILEYADLSPDSAAH